jgi:hypothetical protein
MHNEWLRVCIGHKRPSFGLWKGFSFVTYNKQEPTDWGLQSFEILSERLPDNIIGEYHYLFALRRQLEASDNIKSISITQYRRFVSREQLGTPSSNKPWSSVMPENEAAKISPELLMPSQGDWLVTTLKKCDPNITTQFAHCHPIRDWFRFLSDCCDTGALSSEEAYYASHTNLLLPAPSNGCFPLKVFVNHMQRLESCATAFLLSGYRPYDGYQRRIIGFCLERLHGFFIQKSLVENGINLMDVMGHHITINDGDTIKATI